MILGGVRKKSGQFTLNIDDLRLSGDRVYGVIGPNGSGKTTLAKIISGLLEADSGLIDREGLSLRDVTYIPHTPYMMAGTVRENLAYPLKLRKVEASDKLIDNALASLSLLEKKNQAARTLSSGEKQKLAFLRASIFQPRCVVIDEALTDLDIDSADKVERMILETQKRDPVLWIVVSHDLPQIKRICDDVIFMDGGEVLAQGSGHDMLTQAQGAALPEKLKRYINHETLR
jgi:ABC-type multidrug transport system ATPase subunit